MRGIIEQVDNGDWTVTSTGQQGSGILSSMSLANAFIAYGTIRCPTTRLRRKRGEALTKEGFSTPAMATLKIDVEYIDYAWRRLLDNPVLRS